MSISTAESPKWYQECKEKWPPAVHVLIYFWALLEYLLYLCEVAAIDTV